MEENLWYKKEPLLSHNGLFNMVLGARSTGKTFCFKEWAVSKMKSQCVWVRRYQEDIEDMSDKFLTDLIQEGKIDPEAHEYKIDYQCL